MGTTLFVCTGNLCRSPMAEAIARALAPGQSFASAGTWAGRGHPATREAVAAVAEAGADLADHRSQPLTRALLEAADRVYVMTRSHQRAVADMVPAAAGRTELLDPTGAEIADPYGLPLQDYRTCRDQIVAALEARLMAGR